MILSGDLRSKEVLRKQILEHFWSISIFWGIPQTYLNKPKEEISSKEFKTFKKNLLEEPI